jgi:glycosyltransferase involved in cell wall biosynthesis
MRYSTIIPVYNSDISPLKRAIQSVLDQTLKSSEIIIVNDGSTNEFTNQFLNDLPFLDISIVKVVNKQNEGAAIARNYGASFCSYDLLAFLDSDDAWEIDKMEKQVDFLIKNNQFKSVSCVYKPLPKWCENVSKDNIEILNLKKQILRNHIQTSTFVIYRSFFNEIKGFPINQTHAEEGDLFFKNLQHFLIPIFHYPFVIYGNGNSEFNINGLSGNLIGMYRGEIQNIKRLVNRNQINLFLGLVYFLFSFVKFCIRALKRNING